MDEVFEEGLRSVLGLGRGPVASERPNEISRVSVSAGEGLSLRYAFDSAGWRGGVQSGGSCGDSDSDEP
eukprot:4774669-Alexandrium_andersonii.AAC.1